MDAAMITQKSVKYVELNLLTMKQKFVLIAKKQKLMKPRPEELPSTTIKVPTGHGNLYITITELDGEPFEVFATIGRCGASIMAKAEGISRLVSIILRSEIEDAVKIVVKSLINISGDQPMPWKDTVIKSIPDAIGQVLKRRYLVKGGKEDESTLEKESKNPIP